MLLFLFHFITIIGTFHLESYKKTMLHSKIHFANVKIFGISTFARSKICIFYLEKNGVEGKDDFEENLNVSDFI